MCELLNSTKRLASKRGLDPREVVCPPDKQAICTETHCVLLDLAESKVTVLPSETMEKFYERSQKSLQMIRERVNKEPLL